MIFDPTLFSNEKIAAEMLRLAKKFHLNGVNDDPIFYEAPERIPILAGAY